LLDHSHLFDVLHLLRPITIIDGPSKMIANPGFEEPPPGSPSVPAHPCDSCRTSKLKCDQSLPSCDTCRKRDKVVSRPEGSLAEIQCRYSTTEGYADGRVRRFHRRSRNGCSHCKTRRVRCDEQKPICGGCKRKHAEDMVGDSLGVADG
jgi:hypothetical protein